MRTRCDDIKDRLSAMRENGLSPDQELRALEIETLIELNSTMVFIKENTRDMCAQGRTR